MYNVHEMNWIKQPISFEVHQFILQFETYLSLNLEELGLEAAEGGDPGNGPSLGDDGQLVVALLAHDLDCVLHGDSRQDAKDKSQ